MGKIKVHGISTYNPQKVTLALFEKEVDFEVVYVDMRTGEHMKPTFMSMQPFHQTPVFEWGDLKIFESRAIVRYIAQKFASQGTPLLGETLEEQAIINQWVEVESHNLNEPFKVLSMEYYLSYRMKDRPLDKEVVAEKTQKLEEVFDVFEAQLSKTKYLASNSYSMADLTCTPTLLRLMAIKPEVITSRKNVKAWYEELSSRPAFKKMLEKDAEWYVAYGPFLSEAKEHDVLASAPIADDN